MRNIFIILFITVFLHANDTLAKTTSYETRDDQNIVETFVQKNNKLVYNFSDPNRQTQVDAVNNSEGELLSYKHTDLKKNIITEYSFEDGYLLGKRIHKGKTKTWKKNLKGLSIVLFPELEFKDFSKDPTQKEKSYISMRFDNQKIFVTKAIRKPYGKKTPEGVFAENAIKITFRYVSDRIAYFVYFFDKDGVAVQKNMYILNPKVPKIVLWLKK